MVNAARQFLHKFNNALGLVTMLAMVTGCQVLLPPTAEPLTKNPAANTTKAATDSSPVPVPVGTSVPATLQVGPGSGIEIVYAETDLQASTSIVYAADPANPASKRELARFNHREGYPPVGRVSRDGKQAAVLVVPPDASEGSARKNGAQIWLVSASNTGTKLLRDKAGFLGQWSPDGTGLVAGRYIPASNSTDDLVPDPVELFLVDTLTGAEQVIRTEDGSRSLRPLGWSADSTTFYAAYNLVDGWSIDGWRKGEDAWSPLFRLPPGKDFSSISLSPDSSALLLVEEVGDQEVITLQPIDGSNPRQITSVAKGNLSVGRASAVWNQLGSLLVFAPGADRQEPKILRVNSALSAAIEELPGIGLPVDAHQGIVPLSWSPDGTWLVYRDYKDQELPLYLQKYATGEFTRLPITHAGAGLTFMGWSFQ